MRFIYIVVAVFVMNFLESYGMHVGVKHASSAPMLVSVSEGEFISNSSKFQKALSILQSEEGNRKEGAEAMVNEALDGNMFAIEFLYNSFGISDLGKEISRNGKKFVIEEVMFSF